MTEPQTSDSPYPFLPSEGDAFGIAISGGGIRAACLGLGALQVLEEKNLLTRADFLSAVSGGAYIAAAYTASRAKDFEPSKAVPRDCWPWVRGSHEEEHLKRHLRYLAEDFGDAVVFGFGYLWRLAVNALTIVALFAVAGTAAGWLFARAGLLEVTGGTSAPYSPARWAVGAGLVIVATLVELVTERTRGLREIRFILALAPFVAFIPDVAVLVGSVRVAELSSSMKDVLLAIGATALLVALVLRTQWSLLQRRWRQLVQITFQVLLGLTFLAVYAIPMSYFAVRGDSSSAAGLIVAGGVLIVAAGGFVLHANRTSLHALYEDRLLRAFVVRTGGRRKRARPIAGRVQLDAVRLCDLAEVRPELVICTAVNLRDRESAHGEGCASFVFTPSLVGSPALPDPHYIPTHRFCENAPGDATLSSLIAASGAAIAPNMGRFTRRNLRLALVLLNLRLGKWIRTPIVISRALDESARQEGGRGPGTFRVLQEALGWLSVRNQWLFISDGGHWDNSGVVELLRRRCSTIIAMDASSDRACVSNFLRAMSLARSELGVEFEADASLLESRDPVLRIRFRYPDDQPTDPSRYLVWMRTIVVDEMPADIVAMARGRGPFPRHSTLNQFFSNREFTGYIALGRWLAARAVAVARLEPAVDLVGADEVEGLSWGEDRARLVPRDR